MRIFFYHHQIISHEELGQVREHKSQGETRGHETSPKTMESQAIKQRQISSYITKLNIIHDKVKVYKYPSVEPSAYKELSIKCKELKVASDGTYDSLPPQPYLFDPNVRVYPREFRDEESRRHYVFQ